jgi:Ni,Fe-hydrogenase I small subunit
LLGADYRARAGLPAVNVPGCPAHPDWIIGTLWALRANRLDEADLDRFNRPRAFYGKLAHHACPRNEYYEFKASATAYSQQGCLFENLGCKGTLCESDCNERLWLARTGSCTRGGFPCLSCTSPVFPDGFVPFFETAKIGGIPTSLPLDVPKAWYVGISGLSKLACPERLRRNAVSFKPVWADKKEPPPDGY